jgi:MFS transporter, DHA1 family, multidrug resistance protein
MIQPPIWLIIFIQGLALITDAFYTSALQSVANYFHTADATLTFTIYLIGFALGTFGWGDFSDRYGRRNAVSASLLSYLLGSSICAFAPSMMVFLIGRFVQGIGCSVSASVLQAICRDAFNDTQRAKIYSLSGALLAIPLALLPILGGYLIELLNWRAIFFVLCAIALVLLIVSFLKLPETHSATEVRGSFKHLIGAFFTDRKVIGFSVLFGLCTGLQLSYYAEGSFCLIDLLGLTPVMYGMTFIVVALAGLIGGAMSHILQNYASSLNALCCGLGILGTGAAIFISGMLLLNSMAVLPGITIAYILVSIFIILIGIAIITPNVLALALKDYNNNVGRAASLFGFLSYIISSLVTYGMKLVHTGTLLAMPSYFVVLFVLMIAAYVLVHEKRHQSLTTT